MPDGIAHIDDGTMKTCLFIMMVLIPAAALLPFAARLRRRWDGDRYREEMLFEDELRRREQQKLTEHDLCKSKNT